MHPIIAFGLFFEQSDKKFKKIPRKLRQKRDDTFLRPVVYAAREKNMSAASFMCK